MKVCFGCDLHLPIYKNALHYDVLEWALNDMKNKKADCFIYAGDVTCDGNLDVYEYFLKRVNETGLEFIYFPGNSDLRDERVSGEISKMASPCMNVIDGVKIFAINDCKQMISADDLDALNEADNESIVVMHHPLFAFDIDTQNTIENWHKENPDAMLFYGHLHKDIREGNKISLQAMDPDKAIGECPCVTYYDTVTKEITKSHYDCPVPKDIFDYFGISCYNAMEQIDFAIENKLKNIELRPGFLDKDIDTIKAKIEKWKNSGGEDLSLHLPDIKYIDGEVVTEENLDRYIEFAREVGVTRFTQHVPVVSVNTVRADENVLKRISKALADRLNTLDGDIVLGVENMHMTAKDTADERRFGYIPEECIEFMECIQSMCKHKVGINFDIGHARNNSPFSQNYQIGTWLSMVGKHLVGYHIHQVNVEGKKYDNHVAIKDVYGWLISYASLFKYWEKGQINKAPFVFEICEKDGYRVTLDAFNKHR